MCYENIEIANEVREDYVNAPTVLVAINFGMDLCDASIPWRTSLLKSLHTSRTLPWSRPLTKHCQLRSTVYASCCIRIRKIYALPTTPQHTKNFIEHLSISENDCFGRSQSHWCNVTIRLLFQRSQLVARHRSRSLAFQLHPLLPNSGPHSTLQKPPSA